MQAAAAAAAPGAQQADGPAEIADPAGTGPTETFDEEAPVPSLWGRWATLAGLLLLLAVAAVAVLFPHSRGRRNVVSQYHFFARPAGRLAADPVTAPTTASTTVCSVTPLGKVPDGQNTVNRSGQAAAVAESKSGERVGLLIAGNSGLPGGSMGHIGTEHGEKENVHAQHYETQEEDVISSWLIAESEATRADVKSKKKEEQMRDIFIVVDGSRIFSASSSESGLHIFTS